MSKVNVELTEETFIGGVLRPAGYVMAVDLDDLGVKKLGEKADAEDEKPEAADKTANLKKAGRNREQPEYEVAAVAPTGPNPTAPQALPEDTLQASESFVSPEGRVVPEKTEAKRAAK